MSTVCVFGSSSEAIDRRYLDAAYSLGAAICRRGEGMIFGAGKYGIMGAAARGYMSEGGVPTGVSPHFFRERNVLLEDCNLVFTDSMRERKALFSPTQCASARRTWRTTPTRLSSARAASAP